MKKVKLSWGFCQSNSDEILASGLKQLKSVAKCDPSIRPPSVAGNYVISNNDTPLYIGEAGNLASRLKQQFRKTTSTFYKNYAKKQNQLDIAKNLQIEDFDAQYIKTEIGRKELEEFCIVNFPTPLNKLQRGKRDIYKSTVNRVKIKMTLSSVSVEGTKPATIRIRKNATLVAGSFSPVSSNTSTVHKDTSATSVSGGTIVYSQSIEKIGHAFIDLEKIGLTLVAPDFLTLSIEASSGTVDTVSTFNWQELF